jgi:hypothetical protein
MRIIEQKLYKGTIVKIDGIPFELSELTKVKSTVGNFSLISTIQKICWNNKK